MSKVKKPVPTVKPVVDIPIETTPDSIIATPVVNGYAEPVGGEELTILAHTIAEEELSKAEIPVVAETVNELSSDRIFTDAEKKQLDGYERTLKRHNDFLESLSTIQNMEIPDNCVIETLGTIANNFSEPQPSADVGVKIETVADEPTEKLGTPITNVKEFLNNLEPLPTVSNELIVDKYLFYKLMKACVNAKGYSGHAAVSRFGEMLGAKTYAEQKAEWHKAQEYLAKEGK
jgi:hypothetical protein